MSRTSTPTGSAVVGRTADVPEQGGIFRKLQREHAELFALLEQLVASDDSALQQELYPEIRKQLVAHARGEEQEFYAALRQDPELQDLTARAEAEHATIDRALETLDEIPLGSARWSEALEDLKQAVEHHVHEEEDVLFVHAKQRIGQHHAETIEQRYIAAKRRIELQM